MEEAPVSARTRCCLLPQSNLIAIRLCIRNTWDGDGDTLLRFLERKAVSQERDRYNLVMIWFGIQRGINSR